MGLCAAKALPAALQEAEPDEDAGNLGVPFTETAHKDEWMDWVDWDDVESRTGGASSSAGAANA